MRRIYHYNVIFPLFITIFLPPFIIIPLLGNLLIDGLVYYLFLQRMQIRLNFPQLLSLVLPAWILGFAADILGVVILIAAEEILPLHLDVVRIWSNVPTLVLVLVTILLVGFIIYHFNRWLLKRRGLSTANASIIALAMGIITAPWFFLIPTTWFQALMGNY